MRSSMMRIDRLVLERERRRMWSERNGRKWFSRSYSDAVAAMQMRVGCKWRRGAEVVGSRAPLFPDEPRATFRRPPPFIRGTVRLLNAGSQVLARIRLI